MTFARDLLAELGGVTPGGDDPQAVLDAWVAGRDAATVIYDSLRLLSPGQRDEFLATWQGDEWAACVIASVTHPDLARLASYARRRDDVILLATHNGPTPPAVFVVERQDR